MSELLLHRGGKSVSRGDLDLITMPESTESYVPVSHYHLADKFLTISQDILTEYTLIGENYGIARQGNQLFAVLNFKNDNTEMGLSVAFRNSYDRSMAIGMAVGSSVFCCDNLSLTGDIVVMKKHTKNVWAELEEQAISVIYKSRKNHEQIMSDADHLKKLRLTDEMAFRLMGLLFGNNIISPRQITVLKDEWLKPSHEEFQPRNMWSYYNACTESLKSSPPVSVMEKHVQLHKALIGYCEKESEAKNV